MPLDTADSMARDGESVHSEKGYATNAEDGESASQKKSFKEQVWEFERGIIKAALEETGGSVTRAAKKLGLTHQGLCYIINYRHKELLGARNPVRIRRTTIIKVKTPQVKKNRSSPKPGS